MGGGLTTPEAIRDFVSYAYHEWQPPAPLYLLLVGDANIDYRDYLGTGKVSQIPMFIVNTSNLMLTPSDAPFSTVDGNDKLPDLWVGRLPAATPQAAGTVINKIVGYELRTNPKPTQALFAADNNEPSFEMLSESFITLLPEGITPRRVYLSQGGTTADIQSGISAGALVTTYLGHGSVTNWAGEYLWRSDSVRDDIATLSNNNRLTFVMALNCLNGYFANPMMYSLNESFVVKDGRGAVASFGSSGLGYPIDHEFLGNAVFSELFTRGERILGAATTQARINAYAKGASEEILTSFELIGDPATQLAW
ncbi:hypothetical protein CCP3SC1_260010 [Gammaproteobacteria bacterium]